MNLTWSKANMLTTVVVIGVITLVSANNDDLGHNSTLSDVTTENSTVDQTFIYLNQSDPEHGVLVNKTKHAGFLHGFIESLSVILVSELGDKTFFIAAIMAMTSNKLNVFLAAISALALMTVLSALLGYVVTSFIPRKYTYYAATALMFLFGLKMLWEAWKMKPEEAEEIQQEVENELVRRGSIASGQLNPDADCRANNGDVEMENQNLNNESEGTEEVTTAPKKKKRVQIQEGSLFGKKCYKIFKVFVNCFTMTFLAEWGDRSQLATIVLASVNDVFGVCVGGVLGHTCCTGLAVVAGALVAKKISVRMVTLIGALVFLGFAIASLFFDPDSEEMIKIDL